MRTNYDVEMMKQVGFCSGIENYSRYLSGRRPGEPPPSGVNAIEGTVDDLAYFGKDSLYRIKLATGTVVQVNNVNARRAAESERVARWEDKVWLSFEPSSVILLKD